MLWRQKKKGNIFRSVRCSNNFGPHFIYAHIFGFVKIREGSFPFIFVLHALWRRKFSEYSEMSSKCLQVVSFQCLKTVDKYSTKTEFS